MNSGKSQPLMSGPHCVRSIELDSRVEVSCDQQTLTGNQRPRDTS